MASQNDGLGRATDGLGRATDGLGAGDRRVAPTLLYY